MNSSRFLIIKEVINQNKGKFNIYKLENLFGSCLTSKIMRKYEISSQQFLKKYISIQKIYQKHKSSQEVEWVDCQRRLFIWFSLLFCNHLNKNYNDLTQQQWQQLSLVFFDKNILDLKYQTLQIQKNVMKARWARQEQNILEKAAKDGKLGKWNDISHQIFFSTQGKYFKAAKQCRQHWLNHLDSSKKKGNWTNEEDLFLLQCVKTNGYGWSNISRLFNGTRTDHMVKNRFNILIKRIFSQNKQSQNDHQILQNLITEVKRSIDLGEPNSSPKKIINRRTIIKRALSSNRTKNGRYAPLQTKNQVKQNTSIFNQSHSIFHENQHQNISNQHNQNNTSVDSIISPFPHPIYTVNLCDWYSWNGLNLELPEYFAFNHLSQNYVCTEHEIK